MQFYAKAKFIRCSPYKLRSIAKFICGKSVGYALSWFSAHENKRIRPLKKVLESALANAHNFSDETIYLGTIRVKEFRVDQGPIFRYYKAGAMGRTTLLCKRSSHLSVVLEN